MTFECADIWLIHPCLLEKPGWLNPHEASNVFHAWENKT